jgi:hypothetical protein
MASTEPYTVIVEEHIEATAKPPKTGLYIGVAVAAFVVLVILIALLIWASRSKDPAFRRPLEDWSP